MHLTIGAPIGRRSLSVVFVVLVAVASSPASGKLPADGAWARYYVHARYSNDRESVSRMTVKLVGTVVENGTKLRWIEVSENFEPERPETAAPKRVQSVYKLLIPERAVLESSAPLKQLVRGWSWHSVSARSSKVATGKQNLQHFDALHRPCVMFFPGPLKALKPTGNPRTVEHQNGRLKIARGLAGRYVARWHAFTVPEQRSMTYDVELWLHRRVPLGLAAAKLTRTYRFKLDGAKGVEKVRVVSDEEYTLEAWGRDAKSALPNAN